MKRCKKKKKKEGLEQLPTYHAAELGMKPANTIVSCLKFHITLRHGRDLFRGTRIEFPPPRKFCFTRNWIFAQCNFPVDWR